MAGGKDRKITQSVPRTGASVADQKSTHANSSNEAGQKSEGLLPSEQRLYDIVSQSVELVGNQLSNNLRVNNKVLTDVLYENIVGILDDQYKNGDFIKWIADTLISQGAVIRERGSPEQP